MRTRRIENEWLLLEELQQANSSRLRIERGPDHFNVTAEGFPALLDQPANATQLASSIQRTHNLRIVFPRYYPTMPAEVYLDTPVFHPNVHPDTGFICLWTKHRVVTTLEKTLAQLQRVLAWELLNPAEEHVMQPAALDWYRQPGVSESLPLDFASFVPVCSDAWALDAAPLRRRLS